MTDWSPTSPLQERPPLYRSSEPRVAGIASGIAEYFSVSASIVRVLFGVFTLAGGAGYLLYLGLWVLIPPPPHLSGAEGTERSARSMILGGGILAIAILLGLLTIGGFDWLRFIMLSLLFIGMTLLNRRPTSTLASPAQMPAPPAPMPIPPPPDVVPPPPVDDGSITLPMPSFASDSDLTSDSDSDLGSDTTTEFGSDLGSDATTEFDSATEELVSGEWPEPTTQMPEPTTQVSQPEAEVSQPEAEVSQPEAPLQLPPPVASQPVPPVSPLPPAPPVQDSGVGQAAQRSHWAVTKTAEETSLTSGKPTPPSGPFASITVAAILAVLGIALVLNTLADIFVGAVTVSGISLAFVGIAIAVTSYRGTTLPLIPIALVALVALLAAPTIDHALQDGTGSRNLEIASVEDLDARYVLGVGELVLDLRDMELTEDVTLDVEVGTGALEVWVPRDMVVEVNAKTTVGYAWALNEGQGGINPKLLVRPPSSTDPEAPRLFINAETTIGGIDVYRR